MADSEPTMPHRSEGQTGPEQPGPGQAGPEQPGPEQPGPGQTGPGHPQQPSASEEEALRAAYEDQLRQITSIDLLMQSAASLVNLAARRLGLTSESPGERDLEQARDAIDGVRALLPVVERRVPQAQVAPLRDAIAQLQLAYARAAQAVEPGMARTAGEQGPPAAGGAAQRAPEPGAPAAAQPGAANEQGRGAQRAEAREPGGEGAGEAGPGSDSGPQEHPGARPGPAEASGRLWVPGKR